MESPSLRHLKERSRVLRQEGAAAWNTGSSSAGLAKGKPRGMGAAPRLQKADAAPRPPSCRERVRGADTPAAAALVGLPRLPLSARRRVGALAPILNQLHTYAYPETPIPCHVEQTWLLLSPGTHMHDRR
jgi:hypothetical protein